MDRKIRLYASDACPRRTLDLVKLENYFQLNGCQIVQDPSTATDIIFVTCGFVERNIRMCLQAIELLKRYPGRLIVGGCLYDIDQKRFLEHHSGDFFTTKNISEVDEYFPEFEISFDSVPDANRRNDWKDIGNLLGEHKMGIVSKVYKNPYVHSFWAIRIGFGCNCKCTYCSHMNAIGKYRDKSVTECLEEFKKGCDAGRDKFLITSMDTGYYGYNEHVSLPGLLDKFLEINPKAQFFIEDINPMWIPKYVEDYKRLIRSGNIIQIQSPFQSGSAAIIDKMKRKYDFEVVKDFFRFFVDFNSDNILMSEMIVGFPTETEEDFYETVNFVKDSKMDFTYVYPYYENEHIESRNIFPKCTPEMIKDRLDKSILFFEENEIGYFLFKQ